MNQSLFTVVQAGVHASWQDQGRRRSFQHGVTEGGCMDIGAAMWANRLLEQDTRRPLVEITVGLFEIIFESECQIALTGADLGARLNGHRITPWQSLPVRVGDHLKFDMPAAGLRAYLAFAAQIDLERNFDSVSTVVRENLGGVAGRILQVADTCCGVPARLPAYNRQVPQKYIPDYSTPLNLELIPGYQFDQFPQNAIDALLSNEYEINNTSNRMAYPLTGEPIRHKIDQLLSEGIAYGAVQVPLDGQPVILLNDRQTMGGYAKLGCITRLSGTALAQRGFPSKIRFIKKTCDEARQDYCELLAFFARSVAN